MDEKPTQYKLTVKTENKNELNEMLSASKMSGMLWELQHNFWRRWKHDDSNLDVDTLREAISQLFEEWEIDIDSLNN